MAKGDIITGRISGVGNFQPAAGIEIMITAVTNFANVPSEWGLNVGTARDDFASVPAATTVFTVSVKAGITNACQLYTADGGTYSGVQVK